MDRLQAGDADAAVLAEERRLERAVMVERRVDTSLRLK